MELPPHTATGPITYGRRLPFALSELIELPPHAPSALLAEEWLLPTSAYKPAEEEEEDDDDDEEGEVDDEDEDEDDDEDDNEDDEDDYVNDDVRNAVSIQ